MERLGGFPEGMFIGSLATVALIFIFKIYFMVTDKPEKDVQKYPVGLRLFYIPWADNKAEKVTILQYNGWKKYIVLNKFHETLEVSESCLREIKQLDVKV